MDNPFSTIMERLEEIENSLKLLIDKFLKSDLDRQDKIIAEDITYTIKELAVYLECSKSTVHRYKDNKSIPYYQVGRKVSFKKSEIDKARSSLKKRK